MLLWVEHGAAEKKGRKRKRRCRRWIPSGGPAPPDSIVDDLTLRRNDHVVFRRDDGASGSIDPLPFAARKGARPITIAFDAQTDRHALGPRYLHGKRNGKAPKLSPGVPETCPYVAVGEFFAETLKL